MSKTRITIPVFIPHTGCPHCCVFCNQWRVTGSKKIPDRDSIDDTVRRYVSKLPLTVKRVELAFFGGSFTGIDPELQAMYLSWVEPYIKSGAVSSIRVSTRPDYISRETAALLKRYNVETVEVGVQSFSDDVLEASGRGHSSDDSIKAVNLLRSEGFRTGIQLLPGLPLDTVEKSLRSAETALSLLPDDVRIYPAVVLRDTALEKLYRVGKYSPMTIEETVSLCAEMYGMFHEKGINVIRMGLHPMDLSDEETPVIAGPYHPALGFMIKSRYRRNVLEKLMKDYLSLNPYLTKAEILLPPENREEYIGMKRENIFYLKEKFFLTELSVRFTDNPEPLIH